MCVRKSYVSKSRVKKLCEDKLCAGKFRVMSCVRVWEVRHTGSLNPPQDGMCSRIMVARGWRTSFAAVPGRSGQSDSKNTHEELNGAVNHESLGSRRSNSFRRGNQDSRSMTASADTSKHVQQTCGSRTSFMLGY